MYTCVSLQACHVYPYCCEPHRSCNASRRRILIASAVLRRWRGVRTWMHVTCMALAARVRSAVLHWPTPSRLR